MKNLKLNELSKQQMRQLIGGEDRKIVRSENVNGENWKITYIDTFDEEGFPLERNISCLCACKYANQGGSSTDANHSANDAGSLRSY